MIAQIFPLSDDAPFIHPRELARLVSTRFPNSVIDWEQGNVKLQTELEQLKSAGTPEPILKGHMNLFDNTAYVEVLAQQNQRIGVRFVAYPDSPIDIESTHPPQNHNENVQVQRLVSELAECLKYDVEFES